MTRIVFQTPEQPAAPIQQHAMSMYSDEGQIKSSEPDDRNWSWARRSPNLDTMLQSSHSASIEVMHHNTSLIESLHSTAYGGVSNPPLWNQCSGKLEYHSECPIQYMNLSVHTLVVEHGADLHKLLSLAWNQPTLFIRKWSAT